MTDVVERAKAALSEHVTSAPWVVNREGWACVSSGSDSVFHAYYEGDCPSCGDEITPVDARVAISIEDAEFIAAARSLVPELVAEVERTREAAQTLGRISHRMQQTVLDITGLRHLIDESGDGPWDVVWERLTELPTGMVQRGVKPCC